MSAEDNIEATQMAAAGKPQGTLKRYAVMVLFLALVALAGLGIFVAHTFARRNFHVVSDGRVYRSGQMDVARLTQVVRERGIKTIVNLRGPAEGVKGEWHARGDKCVAAIGRGAF